MKLSALIEMTKLTNIDKAISEIKPPIFWKDKPFYIAQIKKWNSQKIKNILNSTFNLEVTVKSNSSINHDLLIKKLMVDICNLANV